MIATVYAARKALFETSNRVLLGAVVALSIGLCANSAFTYGIYRDSLQRPPLVVGIDQQTGAVTALKPESLKLDVNDVILRSFLENFVRMHFERLPVVSRTDYNRSLFAMAGSLTGPASPVKNDWKEITALDTPGQEQEIQVDVQNSTYTGTQNGCHPDGEARPCTATVYFTKTFFNPADHAIAYRKSSIVTLNFFLRRTVKNDEIQTNPIGLLVTDLHESEGH